MNYTAQRFFSEFHDRTVLFRAGRLIFTTYGVLVGGAFFAGLTASCAYVAAVGLPPAVFAQFVPLALVAVLVGAVEKSFADAVLATLGQPAVLTAILGATLAVVLAFGLHFGRVGSWLLPTNKASAKVLSGA